MIYAVTFQRVQTQTLYVETEDGQHYAVDEAKGLVGESHWGDTDFSVDAVTVESSAPSNSLWSAAEQEWV